MKNFDWLSNVNQTGNIEPPHLPPHTQMKQKRNLFTEAALFYKFDILLPQVHHQCVYYKAF